MLYSANYFGTALSSLGIMLIANLGWRSTYTVMGSAGVFVALLTNVIARDRSKPVKKNLNGKKKHAPLTL